MHLPHLLPSEHAPSKTSIQPTTLSGGSGVDRANAVTSFPSREIVPADVERAKKEN